MTFSFVHVDSILKAGIDKEAFLPALPAIGAAAKFIGGTALATGAYEGVKHLWNKVGPASAEQKAKQEEEEDNEENDEYLEGQNWAAPQGQRFDEKYKTYREGPAGKAEFSRLHDSYLKQQGGEALRQERNSNAARDDYGKGNTKAFSTDKDGNVIHNGNKVVAGDNMKDLYAKHGKDISKYNSEAMREFSGKIQNVDQEFAARMAATRDRWTGSKQVEQLKGKGNTAAQMAEARRKSTEDAENQVKTKFKLDNPNIEKPTGSLAPTAIDKAETYLGAK